MRIAYVSRYSARDVRSWSGLNHYIARALEKNGAIIEYIDDLRMPWFLVEKLKERFIPLITGRKYKIDRSISVARSYARQVAHRLKKINADVVFCPANLPIAFLKTDLPVVFYTDACFANVIDYYSDFSNLHSISIRSGHLIEAESFKRSAAVVYSSRWAADMAISFYGVPSEKVHVIPFGGNIENEHTEEDIRIWNEAKDFSKIRLLFIGVDWYRKGGAKAYEVTKALNERGIPAELIVVGCHVPAEFKKEGIVREFMFLNKQIPEQREILYNLYRTSHFFLMPTFAEAFGLVFAEASAFGLPCITHDTGGVSAAVQSGKNGQLFSLDSQPEQMADYITSLWNNPGEYLNLSLNAFRYYHEHLSWHVNGKRLYDLLLQVAGESIEVQKSE
ncbi:MAG: glycosyltransferase family 4 protein [Bacteroidales bacterium]